MEEVAKETMKTSDKQSKKCSLIIWMCGIRKLCVLLPSNIAFLSFWDLEIDPKRVQNEFRVYSDTDGGGWENDGNGGNMEKRIGFL